MRWNSCRHLESERPSTVYFDRYGSNLRLNKTYPPVLTILQGPGMYDSRRPDVPGQDS